MLMNDAYKKMAASELRQGQDVDAQDLRSLD